MTETDLLIRLLAAFAAGGALGLNRDLHHKAAGVRTIGLVSLASAMLVIAVGGASPSQAGYAPVAPVIQGIMTGIGFLGAGVIVRGGTGTTQVHGLTTAAAIWLAAGAGVLCGVAAWSVLGIGIALVFVLLMFGGPLERWAERLNNTGKPSKE